MDGIEETAEAAPEGAQDIALNLWDRTQDFLTGLMRPWNAYQVAIILGILIVAYLLSRVLAPRLHDWLRTREGWPKWRMRFAVLVHRRIKLILFIALIWPLLWTMREITWPSRSYMIGLVANLALAWLVITIITRLISNSFIRSTVRSAGWIWATLIMLDLTTEAQSLLESAALDMGEAQLSMWLVLQAIVVIGGLLTLARFISRTTASGIRKNSEISPSMKVLAVKLLQVVVYGVALTIGMRAVGFDLTGLTFLSGAIGVGIGFGLQKVVSNLVSGVIILMDKSIKPGDVISLGETFGWINSLGARYVSVVTRDGREYLIPNEDLITNQVVNWSHSNDLVRLDIEFGTSYGCDPHTVRKIAITATKAVDRVLEFKAPVCHITGFGDSSVDYILRFWITDPTSGLTNIRGNVYLALWDAFKEHGISIPFPQREVRVLEGSTPASAKDA